MPIISPFKDDRDRARAAIGADRFVEVYLSTPLAVCEARDAKGLYRKARAGEIAEFTGISSPYEAPEQPALGLDTSELGLAECVDALERAIDGRSAAEVVATERATDPPAAHRASSTR